MKKEGIQTRNRKISTKLKKAQKDQRLDSNFRFLDRSGLPWGGAYGMPGGFHPGFPGAAAAAMGHHHSAAAAMAASSYASQVALPPPPMAHGSGGASAFPPHQGASFPSATHTSVGSSLPAAFSGLPLNSSANPSTMAFGWLADGIGQTDHHPM